jgi:hypothetical protein
MDRPLLALLAVAKPWTYWLAPPLLIMTLLYLIALSVGYHRKVLVPRSRLQRGAHTPRQAPHENARDTQVRPTGTRPNRAA